ncbi:MAG TPA: glutathione S-transferase family protein [Polyangiaceae bacterium]|nr:glutathione S-transferase family protein [Polyangiaceae bacterium]
MKLHFHPVSTASRPVVLFCADANISYEPVIVDLMKGAHYEEPFVTLNPSKQVPVLEDGDLVLTESSAILKYLAEKSNSPAYPKDIKARARINERMDWFNTQHYREWGYHLIYPQTFPHHVRPTEEAQRATVEWGREKSEAWLKVLNDNIIGSHKYLCGDTITIADYFGAEILAAGDLIGVTYKRFPNVDRWMSTMRALPGWKKTNEATDGFAASLKGKKFVTIN